MVAVYLLFLVMLLVNGTLLPAVTDDNSNKPGCYKVGKFKKQLKQQQISTDFFCEGHTRRVSIRDCVSFEIVTNACRGFCESWAIPSDPSNFQITQPVTSIGTCCNIMETEPIEVKVLCKNGIRTFVFKSAVNCACYHCKKN